MRNQQDTQAGDPRREELLFKIKQEIRRQKTKPAVGQLKGDSSPSLQAAASRPTEQCDGNTIMTVFLWFEFPTRD